jgi:hypothetical protein
MEADDYDGVRGADDQWHRESGDDDEHAYVGHSIYDQ